MPQILLRDSCSIHSSWEIKFFSRVDRLTAGDGGSEFDLAISGSTGSGRASLGSISHSRGPVQWTVLLLSPHTHALPKHYVPAEENLGLNRVIALRGFTVAHC